MSTHSIMVKGTTFDVDVTGEGLFQTRLGQGEGVLESATLEGLRPLIEKALKVKKVKIEIPVSILDGTHRYRNQGDVTVTNATLTGIHSSSRNPLIRNESGKSSQFTGYGDKLLRRLSPEEAEEIVTLYRQQDEIGRRLKALLDATTISAKKAVEEELAKQGIEK